MEAARAAYSLLEVEPTGAFGAVPLRTNVSSAYPNPIQ